MHVKKQRVDGGSTAVAAARFSPPLQNSSSDHCFSPTRFNDSTTADVILDLHLESFSSDLKPELEPLLPIDSVDQTDVQIYLHSDVLHRSKYFSVLLSDRWRRDSGENSGSSNKFIRLKLTVPATIGTIEFHLKVLQLLYMDDFSSVIDSVSAALSIIHVASQLLFEDCVKACVRFLEAVPWSEDEENRVLDLIPLLRQEESQDLLIRILPVHDNSAELMLRDLVLSVIYDDPNIAPAKDFVAGLLRDFSSRELVGQVLDQTFKFSLQVVKKSLEEYLTPEFMEDDIDKEANRGLNLQEAMTNGKHLLWLVDIMIKLRVADAAMKEWIEQDSFTSDLQLVFQDNEWKNVVPGLPTVLICCTCMFTHAIISGSILATRQVRMKLIKDWLPVLIVLEDTHHVLLPSQRSECRQLEEMFLRIISTLPMSDAKELLLQFLFFTTTHKVECSQSLALAFNTWFRWANRPPQKPC